MDNIILKNSNSCCNALVKLSCWLILAKYGISKLEFIKERTQNATIMEFESRLYLRNRFTIEDNTFFSFIAKVYAKTMFSVSNYVCSPDWSIFCYEGYDSLQQLKTIIRNEIMTISTIFTTISHQYCFQLFQGVQQQILSIIDRPTWSSTNFIYSNYISASLSEIFTEKMKKIIFKYEKYPNNCDLKWLSIQIMSNFDNQCDEENQLWFVSDILNADYSEKLYQYDCSMRSEDELIETLSHWLFKESVQELQKNTKWLMNCKPEQEPTRIFNREQLSSFLNVPIANLELHLTMSSDNEFLVDFNVSEAPHYYVPDHVINEFQSENVHEIKQPSILDLPLSEDFLTSHYNNESELKVGTEIENDLFDTVDSILNEKQNATSSEYNDKILNVKIELEELYEKNDNFKIKKELESTLTLGSDESEKISIPKLQIKGRNEIRRSSRTHRNTYPIIRHKKRGRPRKVDYYNLPISKNGQHKYSAVDVKDCSSWISDNFLEIADIKPAIDRARMYELYTDYCTLKFCTPVDRALFGKIIRKVFPKLKSRRLIQNQVLKYHYVGLKPRFAELERALFHSDSTRVNPKEISLSYIPVEE